MRPRRQKRAARWWTTALVGLLCLARADAELDLETYEAFLAQNRAVFVETSVSQKSINAVVQGCKKKAMRSLLEVRFFQMPWAKTVPLRAPIPAWSKPMSIPLFPD